MLVGGKKLQFINRVDDEIFEIKEVKKTTAKKVSEPEKKTTAGSRKRKAKVDKEAEK